MKNKSTLVIRGDNDKRPKPEIKIINLSTQNYLNNTSVLNVARSNKGPNLLKEVKFKAKSKDKEGRTLKTQKSTIDITTETEFIYSINLDSKENEERMTLGLKVCHENQSEWQYTKQITNSKKF